MDKRPIGIFDSGLGGLTAVKEFGELNSREDIIFFGDTARVPYGTRTAETITQYALEDMSFLLSKGVKLIIAACGTVSSTLPERYARACSVPFVDVVGPTASAAASATKNGKIAVLGTPATIRSGAFVRAITAISPDLQCFPVACPLFVPLVENGYFGSQNEVARIIARQYLAPLAERGVDTVLLGCTHYPLLSDVIFEALDGRATLINSGRETVIHVLSFLEKLGLENNSGGEWQLFTSDNPDGFSSLGEIFLGHALRHEVKRADIFSVSLNKCFRGV
ncbi:MAG: glutamate racemase [Oscillospiraceae bacterium]